MRSISRFVSTNGGFAVLLIILIGLFLVAIGFGPNTLPFSLQSQYSDAAISHWPNALFFQQSVRSGSLPEWRDLLMSGQPFAANPLNKVWYPPQWLVLILPATLHLNMMIWLHLVLAGLGMRAFGLRLGLHNFTAGLMGLAYSLAPRVWVATGAGHLDIVYASAWIPWMLWAVHNAMMDTGPIWTRVGQLSIIGALSLLADMRTSVFSFGAAGAFAVSLLWQQRTLNPSTSLRGEIQGSGRLQRQFSLLTLSGVLILGLTSVQWLPLLQLIPYLSRNGLTPADSAVYSLNPASVLGMVVPERFGFHETLTYAGLTVLILAIIAIVRAPRKHAFWLVLLLFTFLYALGDRGPLWPLLVRVLPPLLWLRVPARAWIVIVVVLTVLAGFGIEALTERRTQRLLPYVGIVLLSVGLAWGLIAGRITLPAGSGMATLVILLLMGVLCLATRRIPQTALMPILALFIMLDLVWMDVSLVHGVPGSMWLDAYQPVAQALHDAGVTRLYTPDYSFPQQAAAYWQNPELGGVDPFQSATYVTAFENATGTHATGYTVTLPPYDNADIHLANRTAVIDPRQLARWDVSHVLTSFALNVPGISLVQRIGDLYLYRNEVLPAGINVTWDGPNRFTASNNSNISINVVSWMPGWNVAPQNHDDTAITVQPGQTIAASYDAPGLGAALVISTVSFILVVALFIAGRTHRG